MAKKSIEEKYKTMDEISHVLSRSGMYVGSTKYEERDWILYNIETGIFETRTINYVPAMLKVVDEVISNCCDEFRRKDNMGLTEILVNIVPDQGKVTVRDNGGIPVVKHKEAGCYLPEFIFGRLRTSSNYNDDDDRNCIGTNGIGVKIANIFSTDFQVMSADSKNEICINWKNNMREIADINVNKCNKDKHYTQTQFKLDFSRFDSNVKGFDKDFVDIIHKRCIDAAAANPGLKVIFKTNGYTETWKFKSFDEYIDLYREYLNTQDKILFKNSLCNAIIFPDSSIDIGFVNGAECSKGTHIRALRNEINNTIVEFLAKKDKMKDLTTRGVDGRYSIFMNITVSNPAYDSQTKECLTTPVDMFSKDPKTKWTVDDKFLKGICKSEIVELVRDWYKKKNAADEEKKIRKLSREANKDLKRPDKYIKCSSKRKAERELWIFEGDSAAAGFRAGRKPETQAGYLMRGVPLNCYGMSGVQVLKNEVFSDLVSILGLKWGKEFKIEDLNFSKIVISSDADVDGDKIAALLLVFMNNWPELFEYNIICRSISPIIIGTKGKDEKKFYTIEDYVANEKKLKGYAIKYCKGLSGLNQKQTKEMYQEPIFHFFKKDETCDLIMKNWFDKDMSDERKRMLGE